MIEPQYQSVIVFTDGQKMPTGLTVAQVDKLLNKALAASCTITLTHHDSGREMVIVPWSVSRVTKYGGLAP